MSVFNDTSHQSGSVPLSGGGMSENEKFSYGYSSLRGKRASMEDFHDAKIHKIEDKMVGLFGVFDGDGGSRAADYVQQNLFKNLLEHPQFVTDTKLAIAETYQSTDQAYLQAENNQLRDAGSTASTAVLVEDRLDGANVGDSRAVVCIGGKDLLKRDLAKEDAISMGYEIQRLKRSKAQIRTLLLSLLLAALLIALAAVGSSQAMKLNNLKNVDDDVFFGVHCDLRDRAGASEEGETLDPSVAHATADAEHVKGSAVEAQAKTAEGAAAAGESATSLAVMAEDMVTSYDAAGAAKNNTVESIDCVRGRAQPADKRHVAVAGQSSFTLSQLIVGSFLTACGIAAMIVVPYCIWRRTERHQERRFQATEAGANRRHLELIRRDLDVEAGLAHIPIDSNGSPIPTFSRTSEMEVLPRIEVAVAAENMTDAAQIDR